MKYRDRNACPKCGSIRWWRLSGTVFEVESMVEKCSTEGCDYWMTTDEMYSGVELRNTGTNNTSMGLEREEEKVDGN